jgi:hypothetical protein
MGTHVPGNLKYAQGVREKSRLLNLEKEVGQDLTPTQLIVFHVGENM